MDDQEQTVGVRKIVSGGQTGVDRGALDAAIDLGIEHGGWCPLGRIAEDGVIPAVYHLQESDSPDYPVRTEQNVIDSDGTLILYQARLWGGTDLTRRLAVKFKKPLLLVDLAQAVDLSAIRDWLAQNDIQALNVAGPRESNYPGVGQAARHIINRLVSDPSVRRLDPF